MKSSILAASVLALSLQANAGSSLSIAIPAPENDVSTLYGTDLDTTSAGALAIAALSGARYEKGLASSAGISETTDSALSLRYSLVASSGDGAYGTGARIELPLVKSWAAKDLHTAGTLTFKAKSTVAGLPLEVRIGSDLYGTKIAAVKGSLVSSVDSLGTDYKAYTVQLHRSISFQTWVESECECDLSTTGWFDHVTSGDTVNIAAAVKSLIFTSNLDGSWTDSGRAFKTTAQAQAATANTLSIKDVSIASWLEDGCAFCSGLSVADGSVAAFQVAYDAGLRLSYSVGGTSARIQVRRLDGSVAASFQESATAQGLHVPLALSRGTYLVSVQGIGSRQAALLSVAR